MERIGLVGLANAGKSSLFNALTGQATLVAPHPYSTTQSTVAIAEVPDPRVEELALLSRSKRIVHTGFEVVDIGGLQTGTGRGDGLGNRFLAGVREVDALCYVLRAFADDQVPGEADPVEACHLIELELVLADAATVESQLAKRRKAARMDASQAKAVEALEAADAALGGGTPIHRAGLEAGCHDELKGMFLLTDKPVLCVVNLGEDQLGGAGAKLVEEVLHVLSPDRHGPAGAGRTDGQGPGGTARPDGEGPAGAGRTEVLDACVQLEAEAAALDPDERAEMLEGLGLGRGALARVAEASYHLLGRRTFLTTGEKESRAWTFRAGATAPQCAGVIHSDLQRGFIRAEVIAYAELVGLGSWSAAKAAGKVRIEGKDYVVEDGDVLEIRYNV